MTVRLRAPESRARSVHGELRVLFRALVAIVAVLLLFNVGARTYLMARLQPQVQTMRDVQQQLDGLHAALVDEETGLRGYVATASPTFLDPYSKAVPLAAAADRRLASYSLSRRMTRDLVALQVAEQRWADEWAAPAAEPATAEALSARGAGARLTFLLRGKSLFDAYRGAYEHFAADIRGALRHADAVVDEWLVGSGIGQAMLGLIALAVTVGVSRRLHRLIARPVAALARTVGDIRAGDLQARVDVVESTTELASLSRDIDDMARQLESRAELAQARREDAERHGARLSVVLDAAREIAGSLSLRYVLEAVTTAAVRVGASRARVWLGDDDERHLALSFDTDAGHKGPRETLQCDVGTGIVGRAAKYGRPVGPEPTDADGVGALAVPMIIGGRVVGVLECFGMPGDGDALGVLEVLGGHAAASLESARLHEQTREHAVTDALTGLGNRRAFDADLDTEVRRSVRYGRPLSLIYVDLDHFKRLNDRYGHHYGDTALQQAAQALRQEMRETDRVYRIGGEELVVVAPETSAADAADAAERLRVAVQRSAGPDAPVVTASFGVAELPAHAGDAAGLTRNADRALYAAKSRGRNQVVVAVAQQQRPSA